MTHAVSTNTGGTWGVTFETAAGDPVDISGYNIEAAILSDLNGDAVPVADGGLTTAVSGAGSNQLDWTLADGHGLSPGVYYLQTRYHTGDGNWRDLSKDTIAIAARGGVGEHRNLFAFNGSVAREVVVALKGDGVPAGGTTGQVLRKASGDDYNTAWSDETTPAWADIEDKPADFPPSAHTHEIAEVTGLDTALAGKEAAGAAATAVAAHEAAADPHPQYATAPELSAVAGGMAISPGHSSVPWIVGAGFENFTNQTITILTNRVYRRPVFVPVPLTCTRGAIMVRTAGSAGALCRFALRKWDRAQGWVFTDLVWESAAISCETTGLKQAVIADVAVAAGWYVFEVITNDAATGFLGITSPQLAINESPFGMQFTASDLRPITTLATVRADIATLIASGFPADSSADVHEAQNMTIGALAVGMG